MNETPSATSETPPACAIGGERGLTEGEIALARLKHRRQRRNAQPVDAPAGDDRRGDIDMGLLARPHDIAIGPRDGGRIEQGVDHQLGRIPRGLLQPKRAHERKFLVLRTADIKRQRARRQPVALAATDQAEIARAEVRLQRTLPDDDEFWFSWNYFKKQKK